MLGMTIPDEFSNANEGQLFGSIWVRFYFLKNPKYTNENSRVGSI